MQGLARRAALVAVMLALTSCCETRCPTDQGGGAIITCARPYAMRSPGWLELRDLTSHTDAEKEAPREPFVRGVWIGGFFDATGEITGTVGDPPKGRSLTRGYLELRTRSFYRPDDKRTRMPPWIEGSRDDESGGSFPASSIAWSNP